MRLVVVGDALLDRDVLGVVDRVAPDAPVPVVDVQTTRERPGGAGLAAVLLAGRGAHVTLASARAPTPRERGCASCSAGPTWRTSPWPRRRRRGC